MTDPHAGEIEHPDRPRRSRDDLGPADFAHPAVTSFVGLGLLIAVGWRFVIDTPLWLDEALSVNIADLPLSELREALERDGHPPLYYVLLHGWMEVFGGGDRAVRALSGVITIATLPLAWLAGRRVGGPRLGWTTVMVFGLSPFVLRYGSETRMYALVMFLVFAWLLSAWACAEHPNVINSAGVVVTTSALLWTHYWSMWLLAAAGGMLVVRWVVSARAGHRDAAAGARGVCVAMVLGGLTFLPWLPSLLYQSEHTGTPWSPPFRPAQLVFTSMVEIAGGPKSETQVFMLVLVILVFLGVFGAAIDARRIEIDLVPRPEARVPAALLVGTAAVASAAVLVTKMGFAPRYAAVYLPFIVLLIALGISRFVGPVIRNGLLVVFVVFSLVGMGLSLQLERTQAGAIADRITATSAAGLVVTCPDQLGPATERALRGTDFEIVTYPRLESPHFVDWVDYGDRNASNDPAAIAAEVLARVGDAPLFVVFAENYKTLEGQCPALVDTIAATRVPQRLEQANGDEYFESMSLMYFAPNP